MEPIKICKICGDQATGFNYKILCCETCKVFFHRNSKLISSSNQKPFQCTANGNCEINQQSRRKCRSCRLEKCLKLGMLREEKSIESKTHQSIPLLELVKANAATSESLLEELFTKAPTFLISPFAPLKSLGPTNRSCNLNDFEQYKINEILSITNILFDEENLPLLELPIDELDFGFFEIYIKQYVKLCKKVEAFSVLKASDQLKIMKPFCYDIMMIRFSYIFNFERCGFPIVVNESPSAAIFMPYDMTEFTKNNPENEFYADQILAFMKMVQSEIGADPILRDLLTILTMFKAQNATTFPEFMRYHFTFYFRLLQRYLEQKLVSTKLAREKLLTLMKLVSQFPQIREYERRLYSTLDCTTTPHIMLEVFDLPA